MIEVLIILACVVACIVPLGRYIARVMNGERVLLTPFIAPLEKTVYRAAGIKPQNEVSWRAYALDVLLFSFFGFLLLFALLLLQGILPLNPQGYSGVSPDLAFNIAMSFVTNTNWQSYGGESTLSPFSQAVGLVVQNFLSAGTGIAVACAMFRGFARKQSKVIGNFWADLTRAILYILLPLSLLFSAAFITQGMVQNAGGQVEIATLEGAKQAVPLGPIASQLSIKQLGSNGGGYFNANSAHPMENPTPLTNALSLVAILLIPAALIYSFGVMVADRRQGVALLVSVFLIFLPLVGVSIWLEQQPNPLLTDLHVDFSQGNMEGKEVRFGTETSVLWATATTATSNGSVNAAHSSLMPLSGMVTLIMMQLGEVVFGGVGSGMYGLMMFVIITVFIGGLMVGRTPEYLGKKLGPFEIKMASLAILIPCAFTLSGTALALMAESGRAGMMHHGSHGFSEVLYAFTSAANNNGSAFGGLSANSVFYNTLLGVAMFMGRFFVIVPVLAIAGSVAAKNTVPVNSGTMPTHTLLFVLMLVGVIIVVGLLTYAPALALGPLVEHLQMISGGAQ